MGLVYIKREAWGQVPQKAIGFSHKNSLGLKKRKPFTVFERAHIDDEEDKQEITVQIIHRAATNDLVHFWY